MQILKEKKKMKMFKKFIIFLKEELILLKNT
jgi:hypothetical protein